MRVVSMMLPFIFACLTACSPVNSEFSCNKTAGDSCLTIEQVDSMTRFADDPIVIKKSYKTKIKKKSDFYLSQNDRDSSVWIAHKRQQA